MIEGEDNKAIVSEYLTRNPSFEYVTGLGDTDPSSSRPPSPDHLLLGSFTYDPSSASHIQTFPVDPEVIDLGVDVGVVIFKVDSNWGGDFTCLYRVSCSRKPVKVSTNDRSGYTERLHKKLL